MSKSKFVRVSCRLPTGVVLGSAGIQEGAPGLLDRFVGDFFSEHRLTRVESTAPLQLTLECPEALAGELAKIFRGLAEELDG